MLFLNDYVNIAHMGQTASSTQASDAFRPSDAFFSIQAARDGDIDLLRMFLLKNPALAWAVDKDEQVTPWHSAAQEGHTPVLQLLADVTKTGAVSNTFDPIRKAVNQVDSKGRTALMYACRGGHTACTALLLSLGATLEDLDSEGLTALHYAALASHGGCVQQILRKAGMWGRRGPCPPDDPKLLQFINAGDTMYGRTALHMASWSGQLDGVVALLGADASLTVTTTADCYDSRFPCNCGTSPLHMAAMKGHQQIAAMIVACYVKRARQGDTIPDPRTIHDKYGNTPYQIAQTRRQGAAQLLQLLNPETTLKGLRRSEPTRTTVTGSTAGAVATPKAAPASHAHIGNVDNANAGNQSTSVAGGTQRKTDSSYTLSSTDSKGKDGDQAVTEGSASQRNNDNTEQKRASPSAAEVRALRPSLSGRVSDIVDRLSRNSSAGGASKVPELEPHPEQIFIREGDESSSIGQRNNNNRRHRQQKGGDGLEASCRSGEESDVSSGDDESGSCSSSSGSSTCDDEDGGNDHDGSSVLSSNGRALTVTSSLPSSPGQIPRPNSKHKDMSSAAKEIGTRRMLRMFKDARKAMAAGLPIDDGGFSAPPLQPHMQGHVPRFSDRSGPGVATAGHHQHGQHHAATSPSRTGAKSKQQHHANGHAPPHGDTKAHSEPLPAQQHTGLSEKPVPDFLICPLSYRMFKEPVVAADGYTYEKAFIEKHFASCDPSSITRPGTRQKLANTTLLPNHALRQAVEYWKANNVVPEDMA